MSDEILKVKPLVFFNGRDTEIRQAKSRVGRNGLQSVSAF